MKKLILSFSLLFTMCASKAQSWVYHPFPSDSATWMQEHVGSDGTSYFYRTYLLGDTTISSVTYHKIYMTGNTGYINSVGGYSPGPFSAIDFIGGLREDIPNKKVYFYRANQGTETLLYNFNLNTGDVAFIDSVYSPYDTVMVTGIDSVIIGGVQHRSLVLTNISTGPVQAANWIEGVGSDAGLFDRF